MKMSKAQLKAIVKECLVEILNEGLAGAVEAPSGVQRQTMADSQRNRHGVIPERRTPRGVQQQNDLVKTLAAGNPIYESILADTAATTYQEQSAADRPGFMPKTGVERHVEQSTPEQLFGEEAAGNWMSILSRVGIE